MVRVLFKGGRVDYVPADTLSEHEVKCPCSGENPNCMYCDGLGIVRGRRTAPVLRKTEAQIIRRAVEAAKAERTSATTLDSFRTAMLSKLSQLMPAHHCTVQFAKKYPCTCLTAGALAFRTKHLLEQSTDRVVQLTWHTPQHCDLTVHRYTPLGVQQIDSQVSLDLTGQLVSRRDGAPVLIQPTTPPMRAQRKRDVDKGAGKAAGKASKRYGGTIKTQGSTGLAGRQTPFGDKLRAALDATSDVRLGTDERHLDATRGTHVFREYGSARFGSMPSHDEFDE